MRSFEELIARQAEAALAISRAHHSGWNGTVRPLPPELVAEGRTGAAKWDGTLLFHREEIAETLRRMFREPGREHSPAELEEFRNALRVVLHENMHLLKPRDRGHGDHEERLAYHDDPVVSALEEGATEAWTIRNLDRYIDELGLEEIVPDIKRVTARPKYPHFVAAADELAEHLGEHTELGRDEVLRMIAIEPADRKWRMVSGMVYEHSELSKLGLTSAQRSGAMAEIAAAMKSSYGALTGMPDHPGNPHLQRRAAEVGRDTGTEAWEKGQVALGALIRRYRSGPPARLIQDPAIRPLTNTQRLDPGRFGGRTPGTTSTGPDQGRGSPDR